jgi:murein L,D-transpeptidase YafK
MAAVRQGIEIFPNSGLFDSLARVPVVEAVSEKMPRMPHRLLPVLCLLAFLFLVPEVAVTRENPAPGDSPYVIEISRKAQELRVLQNERVLKRYRIAVGKGGNGAKRRLGDNKTPVGMYHVVEFNPDSRFHFFMHLNYPNLVDAWHGYRSELIDAGEFRAIAAAHRHGRVPPQSTALGGQIGIHGIGELTREKLEIHESNNWTEGCIAVTNDEISELRRFVSIGTRVVINE